eukprot:10583091-Alexandrium_andersonii.AAC.1
MSSEVPHRSGASTPLRDSVRTPRLTHYPTSNGHHSNAYQASRKRTACLCSWMNCPAPVRSPPPSPDER